MAVLQGIRRGRTLSCHKNVTEVKRTWSGDACRKYVFFLKQELSLMGSKNEHKYDPPKPAHVQSLCKRQQSPQLFEQGDGTQPAGPRWPWQAEVICPCKRAFTDYSFQLSIKTASKQKVPIEMLPAGLQLSSIHEQRPRFSLSINRTLQIHSGA